jgi:hypothetical protein
MAPVSCEWISGGRVAAADAATHERMIRDAFEYVVSAAGQRKRK